jgi:putative transposase
MKLTLQIQLLPDKQQADQLKSTIERFNAACSWLAEQGFEMKTANEITLQQHFYYDLRERFGLSAQMAAICTRRVGGIYRQDKSVPLVFRPNAAMPYDCPLSSREAIGGRTGGRARALLQRRLPLAAAAGMRWTL